MYHESILNSVKKHSGIEADYEHFDQEIISFINATLMTLSQIGIGPEDGFAIADESETWGDYLGDEKTIQQLIAVKTYIGLKVRLAFDPPTSSYVLDALKRQADEYEWRLNVQAESLKKT